MSPAEIMAQAKEWHDKASTVNSLSSAQQAIADLSRCIYYMAKLLEPQPAPVKPKAHRHD